MVKVMWMRRWWLAVSVVILGSIAAAVAVWSLDDDKSRRPERVQDEAKTSVVPDLRNEQEWRDRAGRLLPSDGSDEFSIEVGPGAEHCGWQSATFLFVAWPPGSVVPSSAGSRQFVYDPEGLFEDAGYLQGEFVEDLEAPSDVVETGVQTDDVELLIAESDPDGLYFRYNSGRVDRWPRAEPEILCL